MFIFHVKYFGNSPSEKKTVAALRIKQCYEACSTPIITRTVPRVFEGGWKQWFSWEFRQKRSNWILFTKQKASCARNDVGTDGIATFAHPTSDTVCSNWIFWKKIRFWNRPSSVLNNLSESNPDFLQRHILVESPLLSTDGLLEIE